jgi:hypothetical protein
VLSVPSLGARRLQRLRPGARWTVSWAPALPGDLQAVFLGEGAQGLRPWGEAAVAPEVLVPAVDPGAALQRAFRRAPEHAAWWSAALAIPAVPGGQSVWPSTEPYLLARLGRPLRPLHVAGHRTDLDLTWLRVHGYGGSP